MPNRAVDFFLQLLDEPDWDIFYWSVEKREPPARWNGSPILEKCATSSFTVLRLPPDDRLRLKKHAKNEGKVVRMMPELMQKEPDL